NQRPEISTNTEPLETSRTILDSVFETYISSPLPSGCHDGGPSKEINSDGSVATTILGAVLGAGTPVVSGGTSFAMSPGGLSIGARAPCGPLALYQIFPPYR